MSSTDQPARSSGHLSGGWHEAPGADRPFIPPATVDTDAGTLVPRARWPWVLAFLCVAGLLWIFFAYDAPSSTNGLTPPSPEYYGAAAQANAIEAPDRAGAVVPRVRRAGFIMSRVAPTPASPWLDELANKVLTPPEEPLADVAETLSPEWRVSVLSARGIRSDSSAFAGHAAVASLRDDTRQPRASWRVAHVPEPTLAERLQACEGRGLFASARCRLEVCHAYGENAPECSFDPTPALP